MTSPGSSPAGARMAAEVAEQPAVLQGVLDDGSAAAREVAATLATRRPRFVLLAARGTSDHAALYAKYLVEIHLGLPCGLASPSTFTAYGARGDLRDVLVVAVSQSGGSPDLLGTVEAARSCGATTLAVTNAPDSALAAASELALDVRAGTELAVAATKSYTAELLTLFLVVDAWAGGDGADAAAVPDAAADLVARRPEVAELAQRYRFASRLVTTGRGYAYPTAREAALKLMETSYVAAHAFSGADLLHGPLAMVDPQYPVVAVVPGGVGAQAMAPVLERVLERGADLVVLGTDAPPAGAHGFALPGSVQERLHPVVDIVPLQWLALEMAVARGLDPDSPRGLAKVTRTW
jgi:glucosamine--fructose-6-phosphate aminotransferase (isomerizing)